MNAHILLTTPTINSSTGYILGIFISILILGYLIYTLIKPEKF